MPARTIKVPNRMWHGEGELELSFPGGWEVIPCLMNGHSEPELSDNDIKKALSNPGGARAAVVPDGTIQYISPGI